MEKAKLYIWCYRFLNGICNVLDESELKKQIAEELKLHAKTYFELNGLIHSINKTFLNKARNTEKLKLIVIENNKVDEMIDLFAILLEKQSIISLSRLRGIVLDGNSGKEFKRMFNKNISETQNLELEEELVNSNIDEEPESDTKSDKTENTTEDLSEKDMSTEDLSEKDMPKDDEQYGTNDAEKFQEETT